MSYYDDRDRDRDYRRRGLRRLYVGGINRYVRERDLKDLFSRCGRIRDVDLVSNFAFVEFEDSRDAEDAIRKYDGYRLEGDSIQVEYARKGMAPYRSGSGPVSGRCYNCGESGHIARECPTPKGRGERAMRFEENRCFECGEAGHLARDCPDQRGPARRRSRSRSPRSRSPSRSRGHSRSRSPRRDTRRSSRDKERSGRYEEGNDRNDRYNDRRRSRDDRH